MTKWLQSLQQRLAELPAGYTVSLDPAKKGEIAVGTVPEELRPMFALSDAIAGEIEAKYKAHNGNGHADHGHNEEACEAYRREIGFLLEEHETVKAIFYTSLRHELGIVDVPAIGIREGYQVVAIEEQRPPLAEIAVIGMPVPFALADLLGASPSAGGKVAEA